MTLEESWIEDQLEFSRKFCPERWFASIVQTSLLFDPETFDEIFASRGPTMSKHLWEKYSIECKYRLGAFFNVIDPNNLRLVYRWMESKADQTERTIVQELTK